MPPPDPDDPERCAALEASLAELAELDAELSELERLRAENAALRRIALEAIARLDLDQFSDLRKHLDALDRARRQAKP